MPDDEMMAELQFADEQIAALLAALVLIKDDDRTNVEARHAAEQALLTHYAVSKQRADAPSALTGGETS